MPLPPAQNRTVLHLRRIDLQGFRRDDGLYDIEARMVDTKSEACPVEGGRLVEPGEPLHDMSVRLVIDDDLLVHDVQACTDAAPYGVCPQAASSLAKMKGQRIGPGWSAAIRERLAGRQGCTHLSELLKPLATVAFQTLWKARADKPQPVDTNGRPRKIDSCFAYGAQRELVRQRWPAFFEDGG